MSLHSDSDSENQPFLQDIALTEGVANPAAVQPPVTPRPARKSLKQLLLENTTFSNFGLILGWLILANSMSGQAGFGMLELDGVFAVLSIVLRAILDGATFFSGVFGKFALLEVYGGYFYENPIGYIRGLGMTQGEEITHDMGAQAVPLLPVELADDAEAQNVPLLIQADSAMSEKKYKLEYSAKRAWLKCAFATLIVGALVAGPVFAGLTRSAVYSPKATGEASDIVHLLIKLGMSDENLFIQLLKNTISSGRALTGLPYFTSYFANVISAMSLVYLPFKLFFPLFKKEGEQFQKLWPPEEKRTITKTDKKVLWISFALIGICVAGFLNFGELGSKAIAPANAEFLDSPSLGSKKMGQFWNMTGYAYLIWMSIGIVPCLVDRVASYYTQPKAERKLRWGCLTFAVLIAALGAMPNVYQAHMAKQDVGFAVLAALASAILEIEPLYEYATRASRHTHAMWSWTREAASGTALGRRLGCVAVAAA